MRLHTLFTIFSLIAPTALVTAVDPTSVPVIVKQWSEDCQTPTIALSGEMLTRSNHPCYNFGVNKPMLGSTLVNGNFTVYQYNLPFNGEDPSQECNMTLAQQTGKLRTFTNIPIRKCVQGLGLEFDWAPLDRWVGYWIYGYARDTAQPGASTCDDTVQLPHSNIGLTSIKVGDCVFSRRHYVEWGNGTVSDCEYASDPKGNPDDKCIGTRTCKPAYPINQCTLTKTPDESKNVYYHWVSFGGPTTAPTTPSPTKGPSTPTTASPTTKAPVNPKNGADSATPTNIFTIMAMMAIAFVARI